MWQGGGGARAWKRKGEWDVKRMGIATSRQEEMGAVLMCLLEFAAIGEVRRQRTCLCWCSCVDAQDQVQSVRLRMPSHLKFGIHEKHLGH